MENGQGFPGALPEITSGWSAEQLDLMPGEGFWSRIEQIAVKGEMTRGLDIAMQGKSSPRIWLFLHEPGRGDLSAAVAMSFARELAFRDQAALLLDGDDRELALTRWSGRVEAEGWIDLARYGTSVLTSGVPMPFVGRRGYFLGVGSFAPTEVTGEEIDTLVTRLRRQADDLLIVAPADALGRMWAPAASIRILCWDKQTMSAEGAEAVAADLAGADCPLTAVVSFQGSGVAEEKLVESVFAEVDQAGDKPAEVRHDPEEVVLEVPSGDSADDVPEDPIASRVEEVLDEAGVTPVEDPLDDDEAGDDPGWRDLPLEKDAFDEADGENEEGWGAPLTIPEPESGGGTSRVFWVGALAAVVILAAIGVYYFKFVRVPSEGYFKPIDVATETAPPVGGAAGESAGGEGTISSEPALAGLDSVALGDSLALARAAVDSVLTDPSEEEVDASTNEPVVEETVPPAQEATTETTADQPAVFDMTPYGEPVGSKGWALHVYSLPDSAGTANQVKDLDRRGFTSAVRIFDLGEKGRWRRIYLGSFASRSEARAAMPALLEKLRVDWAKPERISTSAPE